MNLPFKKIIPVRIEVHGFALHVSARGPTEGLYETLFSLFLNPHT